MKRKDRSSEMPPLTLSVPRCPKCGEFPRGAVVTIQGRANLETDDNGKTFEYNGHTLTGRYKAITDENGMSTLICGGDHRWKASLVHLGG